MRLMLLLFAVTVAVHVGRNARSTERAPTVEPAPAIAIQPPAVAPERVTNCDGSPRHLPPGPPAIPHRTALLAYDDLGPQAMAWQLVGMSSWQWGTADCFESGDNFEIRVVVYRDLPLSEIQQRYPTIEMRADYRYVEYHAALAYLDEQLAELALPDDEFDFSRLRADLLATRGKLVAALGT